MYEEILYEVSDPVATVTLNRPEALNAFTPRMGAEIRHAVSRAERDRRVVGIILTGAGKGFCAGADMKVLASLTQSDGESDDDPLGEDQLPAELRDAVAGDPSWGDDLRGTHVYLLSVPKPVIVAINAAVAGMGGHIHLAG